MNRDNLYWLKLSSTSYNVYEVYSQAKFWDRFSDPGYFWCLWHRGVPLPKKRQVLVPSPLNPTHHVISFICPALFQAIDLNLGN